MTGKAIANPLQALLARAAETLRDTGESARHHARHRAAGAHVVLCDTSSSMADSAGARTRIQHVRDALNQVVQPDHVLLAFNSSVTCMQSVADLPTPSGGTALELGLSEAAARSPAATLVISDGEPNNPAAALDVARRMTGRIDVIYCGDERNSEAVAFMRELAHIGAGRVHVHRWADQGRTPIAATMRLMLAGPRP